MAQVGIKKSLRGKTPVELLIEIGPTIRVDLGIRSRSEPTAKPDLPEKGVLALIDTGATGDCIDNELAERLRLPVVDEGVIINGVGGSHEAKVYMARLYIPELDARLFQPFTGVKLTEGAQMHRVLLGRSFLKNYKLIYDGATGEVELVDSSPEAAPTTG